MGRQPPPVDPRDFEELAEQTRAAIRVALGLGKDAAVPGNGLVHIFARLAEIVSERINRVPEKNLLAFLSLLGIDQQPPQPARVPLTFELAKGATSARVPAGTTAAATAVEGEEQAPTYETERDLVLTATRPVAAFVREPAFDRYRDASAVLADGAGAVPVFEGDQPIGHELYIGDRLLGLARAKQVTLRIQPRISEFRGWPHALSWSAFDGEVWQPVSPWVSPAAGEWELSFFVEGIVPALVAGTSQPWLRARLDTSLPSLEQADGDQAEPPTLRQQGLPPDAAFAGNVPLDVGGPLAPFAAGPPSNAFLIACDRAFTKPGALISIDVELDTPATAGPGQPVVTWQTWGGDGWRTLGTSSWDTNPAVPQGKHWFSDGTQAFTHDGPIVFRLAEQWSAYTIAGVRAHWLRVKVAGGFAVAPVLRRVGISYEWPRPWVTSLQREVRITADGLAPDVIQLDDTPLDASKDFLPFGKEPAFNDAFYIASDEALSLPENKITLRFTATRSVSGSDDLAVTWEVYDATQGQWVAAGATDETEGFTFASDNLVGAVTFTTPKTLGTVELGGVPRYCVRARLTGGDYGHGVILTPGKDANQNDIVETSVATWDPPSIMRIEINYEFATPPFVSPDAIVTVSDFELATPQYDSALFSITRDRRPTCYIGVDGDFANSATMLFLDVPPAVAPAGRPAPPSEPAAVAWEYRAEAGWRPLGVRDETRGFAGRGLLTFVAPADMVRAAEFGVDAYWIRARWERGAYHAAPMLTRLLTNTTWASNVATVRDELLGSATGEERQTFRTARAPVLPGQQIDVRELGTPSAEELATILAEEGKDAVRPVPAEPGHPAESWVRWHEVTDFYASDARSRHYVVDRLSGEVWFGDGRRGMAPPQGRANVRATQYQTGGGVRGNRPEGAITQLKTAVPSVAAVTNRFPAAGGADAEPLSAVRERGPRILRHGNRAVTISDVEDLAREASAAVARVLGVPARSSADAGGIGVVVVPASGARQPVPSVELLERVRAHLADRLPPGAGLWVAGPGWVRIDVTAEVVAITPEQAAEVASAVREALERFLHPLAGGPRGDGWAFGHTPRRSDVVAVIEDITGVDYVRRLVLTATQTRDEPAPGATLPCCGDHQITTTTEG